MGERVGSYVPPQPLRTWCQDLHTFLDRSGHDRKPGFFECQENIDNEFIDTLSGYALEVSLHMQGSVSSVDQNTDRQSFDGMTPSLPKTCQNELTGRNS